ncbi:MAG: hypothetical protein R3F43_05925 [bacterium]
MGQVASQTLEPAPGRSGVRCPDLRPLITTDKQDIMELARRLGTYDISVLPHQDCCTLFVPGAPSTRAPLGLLVAHEEKLAVEAQVQAALDRTETVTPDPAALLLGLVGQRRLARPAGPYAFLPDGRRRRSLVDRFHPRGFTRVKAPEGSFWLPGCGTSLARSRAGPGL